MNAEVKVPSPSILLKRFGRVKAKMNASPYTEAPKALKKRTSLASPIKRETNVRTPTTEIFPRTLLILTSYIELQKSYTIKLIRIAREVSLLPPLDLHALALLPAE